MITYSLIELKAKVDDLNIIRNKIVDLAAKPVGKFIQIDTYFKTLRGRLKIREIKNSDIATIIYYERENVIGPKKSDVNIVEVRRPIALSMKTILDKAFGVKVVVDKVREIYDYQTIQIHLDTVKELGTFIEFEKNVSQDDLCKEREILIELLNKIGVTERNLEKQSYSDLITLKISN